MKRVKKAFATGARVYAAGAELPDNHPVVKASPGLFETVPGQAKRGRGKAKDKPAEEQEDKPAEEQEGTSEEGDGQEDKDAPGADGDT